MTSETTTNTYASVLREVLNTPEVARKMAGLAKAELHSQVVGPAYEWRSGHPGDVGVGPDAGRVLRAASIGSPYAEGLMMALVLMLLDAKAEKVIAEGREQQLAKRVNQYDGLIKDAHAELEQRTKERDSEAAKARHLAGRLESAEEMVAEQARIIRNNEAAYSRLQDAMAAKDEGLTAWTRRAAELEDQVRDTGRTFADVCDRRDELAARVVELETQLAQAEERADRHARRADGQEM